MFTTQLIIVTPSPRENTMKEVFFLYYGILLHVKNIIIDNIVLK